MATLESYTQAIGEESKDLRLNLGSVLQSSSLDPAQRHAVALASALFLRATELAEALIETGREHLTPALIADAKAAASIMAMNTVYYRFRHMVGKESYAHRQAGLRMTRMARPATSKLVFELCSIACAALAGCEMCIRSHEESLLREGASEENVHDAVRIAAVVQGALVAHDIAAVGASPA